MSENAFDGARSLFGSSAETYQQWKANNPNTDSSQLTFDRFAEAGRRAFHQGGQMSKLGRPISRYRDDPTEGVAESTAPSWEDLNREVKKLRKMYSYPKEDNGSDAVVCYTIALQDGMSRLVRVSVPKSVFEEHSAMLTQPDLHACTLEKCGQEMLALALRGGK